MNSERCLVLAPHTDDGEFGCGGTISKLVEQGTEVFYVAFSICEQSVPPGFPKDILASEVIEATAKLGIRQENVIVKRFSVRRFTESRQEILDEMIRIRESIRPDLVCIPSGSDCHQDHQVIYQEAIRAYKRSSLIGYELPWNNVEFNASLVVPLEKRHVERKTEAIAAYKSQAHRIYSGDAMVSIARARGLQISKEFAEAFHVIRWIDGDAKSEVPKTRQKNLTIDLPRPATQNTTTSANSTSDAYHVAMENSADVGPRVLFIGGTGRCGTSITREVLAEHPKVAALPFEHRFILDPDGLLDFYRSYNASWSPYIADRRIRRLEKFLRRLGGQSRLSSFVGRLAKATEFGRKRLSARQYHGWNLNAVFPGYENSVDQLIDQLVEFEYAGKWVGTESYQWKPRVYHAGPKRRSELKTTLQAFAHNVVGNMLQHRQKDIYVEDNTWNTLFAEDLLDFFPAGKMLHVYRDPRDVVASFVKQRWCPTDVRQACLWYKSLMNQWFEVRKDLPRDRYMEVSLETLTHSATETLTRISRFAEIPLDEAIFKPMLSSSSFGRWKKDFTADDRHILETELAGIVSALGYEVSQTGMPTVSEAA